MKKRVVDYIKLKNHTDASVNLSALKGLKRFGKILKFSNISIILIGGTFLLLSKYREIEETLVNGKQTFLKKIENNPRNETLFKTAHQNLIFEYSDFKDFNSKEDMTGITDARHKLITNWAEGVVLETC